MDATEKTLSVLDALDGASRLGDIAERAQLPKPTVHRILRRLVERGYARAEGGGVYALGPRVLAMAGALLHALDAGYVRAADPARAPRGGRAHRALRDALRRPGDLPREARRPEPAVPVRVTRRRADTAAQHGDRQGGARWAGPSAEAHELVSRRELVRRTPQHDRLAGRARGGARPRPRARVRDRRRGERAQHPLRGRGRARPPRPADARDQRVCADGRGVVRGRAHARAAGGRGGARRCRARSAREPRSQPARPEQFLAFRAPPRRGFLLVLPSRRITFRHMESEEKGGAGHEQVRTGKAGTDDESWGGDQSRALRRVVTGADGRHGARVVRLLHLRNGRRAGVRRPVLRPGVGLRHPGGVRDVRRRLRRAAVRRHAVRTSRRSDRPARDADHHHAGDGLVDRRDRPAADLREHRDLGADPARRPARAPGSRRRRRVRRRVDAARRARAEGAARLLLLVRPDRRADRPRARHAVVPARRAAAGFRPEHVGLACAVPARLRDDRRRAVGAPAR